MKQLILVRHGKSSWDYPVEDKDRPLKERGIADAHRVASILKSQQLQIDAAFASPANRALHTSMIFLRLLHFPMENFSVSNALYDFSGEEVMNFVKEQDNTLNTILLFGHNNAFTNIANYWGNRTISNVPTAGLVQINFDVIQWNKAEKGITTQTLFPKEFK